MRSDDPAEALLVLRAQAGDREAFGELYRLISPAVRRFLSSISGDRTAAEDVLHDVFLTVHRKIAWLRDPASFRPWVYRIAARRAMRGCRASDTQLTDGEWEQLRARATQSPDRELLLETARQHIAELPPASRAVLSLHYLDGMSLEQAAAVLNIPVGTAKSRLSFGIGKLRAWMGAGG